MNATPCQRLTGCAPNHPSFLRHPVSSLSSHQYNLCFHRWWRGTNVLLSEMNCKDRDKVFSLHVLFLVWIYLLRYSVDRWSEKSEKSIYFWYTTSVHHIFPSPCIILFVFSRTRSRSLRTETERRICACAAVSSMCYFMFPLNLWWAKESVSASNDDDI